MSRFLVPVGVGGLLVAALVVAVSGVGGLALLNWSGANGVSLCVDSYDRWQDLTGHWEGTWANHTFSSNGTLTMDVVIHENCTAEATIDGVFGQSGPQHISATYRDENGTVIGVENDPIFGDTTISVATDGTISLDGIGLHQAIESVHATGSVGSGQLDLETSPDLRRRGRGDRDDRTDAGDYGHANTDPDTRSDDHAYAGSVGDSERSGAG